MKMKVGKFAEMVGVHRNTVTNWIKSGKLNAVPAVGRKYQIADDAFRRFCGEMGIGSDVVAAMIAGTGALPAAETVKPEQPQAQSDNGEVTMKENPIGAVMVVGGGIAGIQATLDLADSGYYVYLVEKSAGIGGAMAQLDKTFPTNDCAM